MLAVMPANYGCNNFYFTGFARNMVELVFCVGLNGHEQFSKLHHKNTINSYKITSIHLWM